MTLLTGNAPRPVDGDEQSLLAVAARAGVPLPVAAAVAHAAEPYFLDQLRTSVNSDFDDFADFRWLTRPVIEELVSIGSDLSNSGSRTIPAPRPISWRRQCG